MISRQVSLRASASSLVLSRFSQLSANLSPSKASALLQLTFRLILYIGLLANVRAVPGGWHWRVFWPITKYNLQFLAFRLRNFLFTLLDRKARAQGIARYIDQTSPVGTHPFDFKVIYRSRVSVDESDFNMHMSNSSYPKILDCTRTKMATHLFPHFLRAGGVVPIASTHFHFVKEIPIFAKYEVHAGIGAWDEKWFYVVARFVTKRKLKATDSSQATTPLTKSESSLLRKLFGSLVEDEDTVLHTVAVARCCYKLGRITVPPSVLMATNGVCVYPNEVTMTDLDPSFTGPVDAGLQYSATNPPHTWNNHARDLASKPKKLREFYKGGWRQDSTRWWDSAMGEGGPMKEKLRERLEICRRLFDGMTGVRQFGEQ
ncbi:hypothetical protein BDP27DRAFT_707150 [Rhodocollybia butyracea]|uniref:Uncharacterized protein n=1 Tax=Rhodocollybia butyracea TaxID=206335 RepID=A0A9P5Q8U3_9AGAR|nr:hypothetical protein BDP27DRAFT_707150 [Rhodocollybia butyracea]